MNLKEMTCTCDKWQLNEIPCAHSVSAIYFHKRKPEEYIRAYYHMDKYKKAYDPLIHPMLGPDEWKASREVVVLPPIFRNQPGRP